MSEPLTPAQAYTEVLATETGEILALAAGWLAAMGELMAKYPSIDDVPEPLREFLDKVSGVAGAISKAKVVNEADLLKEGSQ